MSHIFLIFRCDRETDGVRQREVSVFKVQHEGIQTETGTETTSELRVWIRAHISVRHLPQKVQETGAPSQTSVV